MNNLILIVGIAFTFYLLLPGLGAFFVRHRWRVFRRRLTDRSVWPRVNYKAVESLKEGDNAYFRCFGILEAIQGDDIIWLKDGNLSVSAEMQKVDVYMVPSFPQIEEEGQWERNYKLLSQGMLRRTRWERIFTLPEGTKIFLAGEICIQRERAVFRSSAETPLLAVIFDGEGSTLMRRAVWGGRQKNEYWNPLTPTSLAAGSFALIIAGYKLLQAGVAWALPPLALAVSLFPLLPFFPPGLVFYYGYRHFWRRGRQLRAERDLLRLPLRYIGAYNGDPRYARNTWLYPAALPNGKPYLMQQYPSLEEVAAENPEAKVRTPSLKDIKEHKNPAAFLFGASSQEVDKITPAPPMDPLVEFLIIPGDPRELAIRCSRQAYRMEFIAGGFFLGAFLLNLFLAWILISFLIS